MRPASYASSVTLREQRESKRDHVAGTCRRSGTGTYAVRRTWKPVDGAVLVNFAWIY